MKRRCIFRKSFWMLALSSLLSVNAGAQVAEQKNVIELTLEDAIEIAVSENPTVLVADQQIELKKISKIY